VFTHDSQKYVERAVGGLSWAHFLGRFLKLGSVQPGVDPRDAISTRSRLAVGRRGWRLGGGGWPRKRRESSLGLVVPMCA